jgi:DNA repair protein RecO (recombination protein O)
MPLHTAEALILRTYKLGEADRIVVFLTRDRGKKRGVAKGARRVRSRFLGALESMTLGRVRYFEREHRDLVRLDEIEVVRSPFAIADGAAFGHLGYFAELIDEWAPEADPNEKLFRLGSSAVGALAEGVTVDRVARYFEYWLLRLQGVYPSLSRCPWCARDLMEEGAVVAPRERVFVCRRCGQSGVRSASAVSPEALAFLKAARGRQPHRLDAVPLSARASRELETAHQSLIAEHLEKELKSARVLRELNIRIDDSLLS